MSAIERVEAYLAQIQTFSNLGDQIHGANGQPLLASDLRLVLAAAKEAAEPPLEDESYYLIDGAGDGWAYIKGQWFFVGRRPMVMAQQCFDAERGLISTIEEDLDDGAARIFKRYGVRR